MAHYRLTAKAEEDLLNIWQYIAEDNQQAATKLLNILNENFVLLAENKSIGMARPDITPDLRYFSCEELSHLIPTYKQWC